jgi:cytochrome P450
MLGFVNVFSHFLANEHAKFLMNVIEGTLKQRKESEVKRNDLIDMMIDAINQESPNADQEEDLHAVDQYEKDTEIVGITKKKKLSHDDVIATALLMLSAGYDTTGTAMSYILYELALNQDCQETLLEEIREASEDVNNMPYEVLQSLPYLDAVIQETLRKHPVIANLERLCTKDYKIPGHEYVIKKGDVVRVSNVGICFDPDIFPDPKKFNPERFLKENITNRNPYSYMAFSLGPRNCLAMRFALFEIKVCISNLVSNFKFVPSTRTVNEVEWNPRSFLGGAKGGLWIKCEKR